MPSYDEPWFKSWLTWRSRSKITTPEDSRPVQEIYKELVKDRISPALRDLGLKGSAGRYHLPSDGHWALIGFQKSAYSNAEHIKFTVNVLVVSREEWDGIRATRSHYPEKPTAGTHWAAGAQARIGALMPIGEDYWWDLLPSTSTDELSNNVLGTIRDYALPWMRQQIE
jgi:hypothetical protein